MNFFQTNVLKMKYLIIVVDNPLDIPRFIAKFLKSVTLEELNVSGEFFTESIKKFQRKEFDLSGVHISQFLADNPIYFANLEFLFYSRLYFKGITYDFYGDICKNDNEIIKFLSEKEIKSCIVVPQTEDGTFLYSISALEYLEFSKNISDLQRMEVCGDFIVLDP